MNLLNETKLIDYLIGGTGIIYMIFAAATTVDPIITSLLLLVINGYIIWRVRHNRLLLILFGIIGYANYGVVSANYLNPIGGTLYTIYSGTKEAHLALIILVAFISIVVCLLPSRIKHFAFGDSLPSKNRPNNFLLACLLISLICICVFGFARPENLGTERSDPSALYEYSTIFFIVAFYFAGHSKLAKSAVLSLLIIYAVQNLIYGGRVTALQLILVAFLFMFSKRTRTSLLIVIVLIGFVFFLGFGMVRTQIWDQGLSSVIDGFCLRLSNGLAWDTAYSSWHTSITFIIFGESISGSEHLHYLFSWLASIFLGGSVPDSRLPLVTESYYLHFGGGFLPIYAWFYFGIAGIVLVAFAVLAIVYGVNKIEKQVALFKNVLILDLVYLVITVPRWYLYSPSQLTRGLLLCTLVCIFLLLIDRWMSRKPAKDLLLNESAGEIIENKSTSLNWTFNSHSSKYSRKSQLYVRALNQKKNPDRKAIDNCALYRDSAS